MKAIIITKPGAPDVLEYTEVPLPSIRPQDVLIEVYAAGVNKPDIFQRKGNYPAPAGAPQDIPGLEVSGIVVAKGTAVSTFAIGDRVCALVSGGGYAEYVSVPEGQCILISDNIGFEEAAGIPETLFTVYDNVVRRGHLSAGKGFLVHGGSGGIGSMGIQVAHALGAKVYTTVSTTSKAEFCKKLGADIVVQYTEVDFESVLQEEKIHVILDSVGGHYFQKNMNLIQPDGYLVSINAIKGAHVDLDITQMMQKRIHLTGSTLRGREEAFKKNLRDEIVKKIWSFITDRKIKVPVFKVFPLDEASAAHQLMESRDFCGKIILRVKK